jgi:hypothetical protein
MEVPLTLIHSKIEQYSFFPFFFAVSLRIYLSCFKIRPSQEVLCETRTGKTLLIINNRIYEMTTNLDVNR